MAKPLAPSAGALTLALTVEPRPRGRRLLLRAGEGEIELVLHEPLPGAGTRAGPGMGAARLARGPGDPQAAFVAEAARWLGAEPKARKLSTSQPVPIGCVRLDEAGNLEALELTLLLEDRFRGTAAKPARLRLFLDVPGHRALLDLANARGKRAAIDALALALWGPLDPMTEAHVWDPPLVREVRPLVGAPFLVHHFAWLGAEPVLVDNYCSPIALLRWREPDAPPERLLEANGLGTVAARRDASALAVLRARNQAWEVVVLERGEARVLLASAPDFELGGLGELLFSPDGRMLAVGGSEAQAGKRRLLTRVYEVESGRCVDATPPEQDLSPATWSQDGLRLAHLSGKGDQRSWTVFRWTPGVRGLDREDARTLRSPSGGWCLAKRGVPILRGPDGAERQFLGEHAGGFGSSLVDLMEHQTGLARRSEWLGERPVLYHGDRFAYDLATGRVRRLAPRLAPLSFLGADASGRRALFTTPSDTFTREGLVLWGEVEPGW